MRKRYYVKTWDSDLDTFTPQVGVPDGPHNLFGLREVLRQLRNLGYPATRLPREPGQRESESGDPSVLVYSEEGS